jgi:dienelactone hydrolase
MIERRVLVDAAGAELEGDLAIPPGATGVVVFAHGSGSSRFSPRNRLVAGVLRSSGLATLLIDLLTDEEAELDRRTAELRFDIALLAERVVEASAWLRRQPELRSFRLGYFGSSTGAAAALQAAAVLPDVGAVVSRGGRPDLAGDALERVRAPTSLIVGGEDRSVLELNRRSFERLRAEKALVVVPGASHLFEEPGALQLVAAHAASWLALHLADSTLALWAKSV